AARRCCGRAVVDAVGRCRRRLRGEGLRADADADALCALPGFLSWCRRELAGHHRPHAEREAARVRAWLHRGVRGARAGAAVRRGAADALVAAEELAGERDQVALGRGAADHDLVALRLELHRIEDARELLGHLAALL